MESIVLARKDFREVDQIVTLYTKEKGKIELLARGIKKTTSKHAAHCEPFSYCMIEMAAGREIDHLIKVVPIDSFSGIRNDLRKSLAAGYATSLVHQQLEAHESDQRVWHLLLSWLRAVHSTDKYDPILLDGFVLCLFAVLGFQPRLDACVISETLYSDMVRDELSAQKSGVQSPKSGLYFAGGGLVSPEVRQEKQRVGEEVAECGLTEISNMQLLLTANWEKIIASQMEEGEKRQLHGLVLAYAQYHSEKEVADWSMK